MNPIYMPTLTEKPMEIRQDELEEDTPVKQDLKQGVRDEFGRFQKGVSGNPHGRPPAGQTIVDKFRDNPGAQSVINKLFTVAMTLDEAKPHKDSIAAAKLIVERLVPSLKASELRVDTDGDQGFVLLPTPEEPDKE